MDVLVPFLKADKYKTITAPQISLLFGFIPDILLRMDNFNYKNNPSDPINNIQFGP